MNIHRGYMSRLGITEAEAERVKPSLNNESYTSYMRAVAAEEGPAEIMSAVLSCALSYEYIAKWIVTNYPNADQHEFYGEWVQGYASEDYAAENRKLVAYMERLSEGYTCLLYTSDTRKDGTKVNRAALVLPITNAAIG